MQSGLTSSLLETSEDEEAKRKEAEKEAKKSKKGLDEDELKAEIDIELEETETCTLLYIPGVQVAHEGEEFVAVQEANKKYHSLIENKVGSDSYHDRGSQTMNLALKSREIQNKGFVHENKDTQATKWEIEDARKQKTQKESERMEAEYLKTIDEIMTERLKHPQCLIDADALASHVSVRSLDNTAATKTAGVNKSGTNSSKSGGKSSKMKSSQSNLKESVNKSQTSDKLSGTSMSQTQTNAISSETVVGDYANITKKVEYVEVTLPDSMMKAVRIVERLLT